MFKNIVWTECVESYGVRIEYQHISRIQYFTKKKNYWPSTFILSAFHFEKLQDAGSINHSRVYKVLIIWSGCTRRNADYLGGLGARCAVYQQICICIIMCTLQHVWWRLIVWMVMVPLDGTTVACNYLELMCRIGLVMQHIQLSMAFMWESIIIFSIFHWNWCNNNTGYTMLVFGVKKKDNWQNLCWQMCVHGRHNTIGIHKAP